MPRGIKLILPLFILLISQFVMADTTIPPSPKSVPDVPMSGGNTNKDKNKSWDCVNSHYSKNCDDRDRHTGDDDRQNNRLNDRNDGNRDKNHPHYIPTQIITTESPQNFSNQENASYVYVAAQQKACTQSTSFASAVELNIYCVAKFKDSILQHCANIQIDSSTEKICKAAMEIDLKEGKK